jgi:putative nucleotidyltransferase with HDIG domain
MTTAKYTYEKHATSSDVANDPFAGLALLADLSALLERRDPYTHGHGRRVARHAERIARALHLPILETTRIREAAAIHDIGKLATPRAILNNPGRLTAAEFAVLKHHAADGAEMVAAIGDARVTEMVRHHHERVDAGGYPDGLGGSEIPLGARIIAVADTFDALTSDRAYRPAGSPARALDVLAAQAGTQLDANAVAVFLGGRSPRVDNLLSMQSSRASTTAWR